MEITTTFFKLIFPAITGVLAIIYLILLSKDDPKVQKLFLQANRILAFVYMLCGVPLFFLMFIMGAGEFAASSSPMGKAVAAVGIMLVYFGPGIMQVLSNIAFAHEKRRLGLSLSFLPYLPLVVYMHNN